MLQMNSFVEKAHGFSCAQAGLLCPRPSCNLYQADLPQKNQQLWAFLSDLNVSVGKSTSFLVNIPMQAEFVY